MKAFNIRYESGETWRKQKSYLKTHLSLFNPLNKGLFLTILLSGNKMEKSAILAADLGRLRLFNDASANAIMCG